MSESTPNLQAGIAIFSSNQDFAKHITESSVECAILNDPSLAVSLDSVSVIELESNDIGLYFGEFLESHNGKDHLVKFLFKAPFEVSTNKKILQIMSDFRGEEVQSRESDRVILEDGMLVRRIKVNPVTPLQFSVMKKFLSVLD